jgi:hypothetical protein
MAYQNEFVPNAHGPTVGGLLHRARQSLDRARNWVSGFFAAPELPPAKTGEPSAPLMGNLVVDENFVTLLPSNLGNRKIFFTATDDSDLGTMLGALVGKTDNVLKFDSFAAAATVAGRNGAEGGLLVVDIDHFPRTTDVVDSLLSFRKRHPGVVVVIASTTFARHDFSTERRVIADASVRLPCGNSALGLAMSSALDNNRYARGYH